MEPYSILNQPVLSSKTMDDIGELNPELSQAEQDTFQLSFTGGDRTYTHWIEKERWVVVRIQHSGGFDANYYYEDFNGIPALCMMALQGDTLLTDGGGGYRFSNIRINGLTGIKQTVQSSSRSVLNIRYDGPTITVFTPLHWSKSGAVSIFSSDGRMLYSRKINGRHIILNTKDFRHVPAQGYYILSWESKTHTAAYPFLLQK